MGEKIKEYEEKIHELRMEKILTIGYITEKTKKHQKEIDKLDEKLEEIEEKLADCELEEINRYKTLVKAIEARIKLLNHSIQSLNKLRLLIKNLQMEESKYIVLKLKAHVS